MRISKLVAFAGLVAVVPFAQAAAQGCAGMASFSNGPSQIAGSWAHSDVADGYGLGYTYGTAKEWYAGVSVGSVSPKGGSSSTTYGANAGYQLQVGDSPAAFCPMVGYSQSSAAGSKGVFSVGGSLGYPMKGDGMDWIPNVGAMYASTSGSSTTTINVGVGFIFNKQWTVAPAYYIPTQSGAKSSFGVAVGYNWKWY
jgi:hypothetical protein